MVNPSLSQKKWLFYLIPVAMLLVAIVLLIRGPQSLSDTELQVVLLRPNSQNVPDVQQISVTFNKPMVPLGDFEKLSETFKIEVEPQIKCSWRWLNTSTLACLLDNPLPPSQTYKIRVPAGVKALDGSVLKDESKATFTTLLWEVVKTEVEWMAPDQPYIFLAFNQPMDLGSLKNGIKSDCGNIKVEKIPQDAVERVAIHPDRGYLVTFLQSIGLAKKCQIKVLSETKSLGGDLPSKEYVYSFITFPEFKIASVDCFEKIHVTPSGTGPIQVKDCNPDYGVSINLSTPTTGKSLSGKVETHPSFGFSPGGEGSPEYYAQYPDEEYPTIFLRSPLLGRNTHTVKLIDLKDRFGRSLTGTNEVRIATKDFSPMLQLPEGYGVIEKEGPHILSFSGVNTKEFDLNYYTSNQRADSKMWATYNACKQDQSEKSHVPFLYQAQMKKALVTSSGELNLPFTSPIDFSLIDPDFKYGMFVGKVEEARGIDGKPFTAHRICSSFFTVITDLGLTAKIGYYDSGIWVHSLATGKPLGGVRAGIYDKNGMLFEGTTDSSGFVSLPGAREFDPERSKYGNWNELGSLYIVADTPSDFSMLPFDEGRKGLDYYEFTSTHSDYMSSSPLRKSSNHIIHAITDRPLYKPGQTVNMKVFARHWDPKTFGLKRAEEIKLEVRDALNNTVFEKKLTLSDFGTAEANFSLEESASLGGYSIMASVGEFQTYAGQFDVQVFVLPAFKVTATADKPTFEAGSSANFSVTARYHFGGPVAKTKGHFTATFTPGYWRPKNPEWDGYTFDNSIDFNIIGFEKPRAQEVKQIAEGDLTTDAQGNAAGIALLPTDQIKTYGNVEYGISFQDDRGKNIAGYAAAEVLYSQYNVGIKTREWTYEAGKPFVPDLIVLGPQEKPKADVKIRLELIHRTYKTVRRHGEGTYFYYETKTQDKSISSCTPISELTPKGCELTAKAAGDHYIVAQVTDPKGRVSQSAKQIYITGKDYVGWRRENHDRIEIIPDKREYKVGETVKILVKNPYQQVDALITLERFGILKQFRKKLTQGSETISIPIDSKTYAPGFYVGVHLIQGRVSEKIQGNVDLGKPSFKMGLAKIRVLDPDSLLKVKSTSNKEEYEPGDTVDVSIDTGGAGGKVRELSVAVVDEKILQLAGNYEERYKLHEKFYQVPYGDVSTSQMLSFLIGRRHFGKKGAPAGGDGDTGKSLRKNILPLAYWNPTLKTDSSGKARISFNAPDNLTTWRVLVVAVDQDHRFGFGSSTFRASKKIMIEPALPSFLTEGDRFTARFGIFNHSTKLTQIQTTLAAQNLVLKSPSPLSFKVPQGERVLAEWKMETPFGPSSAQLDIRALSTEGNDGLREIIPIIPFASYETFATSGSTTETKITQNLKIPGDIRPELGGLEVILSPTLISQLDEPFKYLFLYPYTCWEQTMVRAMSLASYVALKDYLSIPNLPKDPKVWSKELLSQMPAFQYENGGMAFWKPDLRTVDPYLSTFTALGLVWTKRQGIEGPSKSTQDLLEYIRKIAKGLTPFPEYYSDHSKATVLAMASYVLALEGDDVTPMVNKLFGERAKLSLFGKSFLWMAAAKKKSEKSVLETLKNEIYSSADLTSATIQFKESHDSGYSQVLHSTVRTNCNILEAMLEEDPKGKFVEPLLKWVMDGRKAGRWNNTQENIFCLNAIAHYAKIYEKDTPNLTITGKAMGSELKKQTFQSFKDKPLSEKLNFTPSVAGTEAQLEINKSGKGRLYYTARMQIAYKEIRTTPVNAGLQVDRTYFLKDNKGKWVKQSEKVALKRGQLVKVHLKVTSPAARNQVVLEDHLPAGLEPVNTALTGTSKEDADVGKPESSEQGESDLWSEDDQWFGFYSGGGFYHREMRLSSVQYFAQFIQAKVYELAYVTQAIATGEFNAAPALIQEMYSPEVYGKSTPAEFKITD